MLVGIFLFSLILSPFNPLTQNRIPGITYQEGFPSVTSHDQVLQAALALIPSNASVLTQDNLFPQVSNRLEAYVYLTSNKTSIDFVLGDSESSWYSQEIWGTQSMKSWLPYFLSTGRYGFLVNDDGVVLLEANYSGSVLLSGRTSYVYNYQSLSLYSGSRESDSTSLSGTVLVHSNTDLSGVTFWFGPYASLPPGQYNATFYLKTDQSTTGSLKLMVSNFISATDATLLAERNVSLTSFSAPDIWTAITVPFVYSPQQAITGKLEFKGFDSSGGPCYP